MNRGVLAAKSRKLIQPSEPSSYRHKQGSLYQNPYIKSGSRSTIGLNSNAGNTRNQKPMNTDQGIFSQNIQNQQLTGSSGNLVGNRYKIGGRNLKSAKITRTTGT